MKESIGRLFNMAGEYKGQMILSVSLATVSVALGIVPLFIMYQIIVSVINEAASFSSTAPLALTAGICLILKVVAFSKATTASHRAAYRILYNLRIAAAKKLADLPMGYLTSRTSGSLKKVLVDDIEKLELFLAHNIPETISSLVVPVFVSIFMFFLDWRMALTLLASIPLAYLAMMFMMKDYKPKMLEFNNASENVNATIVEYIKGMAVIKTFNQTTKSFGKYRNSLNDYLNYLMNWFKSSWPYMSAHYVILGAGVVAVLPVGGYFYLSGSLSLPSYILFLLIALGFSVPLIKLTEFIDGIAMIEMAEIDINNILKEAELYKSTKNLVPETYDVEFSNVGFSYEKKEVLRGVSFKARNSTTTALVGPSGAGKTTAAKLIARFWDADRGSITIGGIDIKEIKMEQLMEIVSFVFQDVFLFNDTIIENIRVGRLDATDDEVIEAAKMAMCHDFILNTEEGYNTPIGDGGCKLSGGERQRLSIARSILRDTPIVVLDEATAFTDPENEDKIQESINNLTKNKTLIVIAHRLSTVMHSEKILVIDDGRIAGDGTHEELLKDSLLYKNMWEAHIDSMDWQFGKEEAVNA